MPRGVYDRSKTKTAAVKTEKAEKTAAPKVEKKARAPWGSKTRKTAAAETPVGATGSNQAEQSRPSYGISILELASLRGCFTGSTPNNSIVKKIDTLIERGLDVAVEASAPVEKHPPVEAVEAPVAEKVVKMVQPPAPTATVAQLAAPVAFNPSTPPTQS